MPEMLSATAQFLKEVEKKGVEVSEKKENRGGARPGAGRPKGYRPPPKPANLKRVKITPTISPESKAIYDKQKNKSRFVDAAILEKNEREANEN